MEKWDPNDWGISEVDELRKKVKEMHKYMVKAVTTAYDCEGRKVAQEYDVCD